MTAKIPNNAWLDLVVLACLVALASRVRPDLLFALAWILLFGYIRLTGRPDLWRHLLISLVVALAWTVLGAGFYGYQDVFVSLGPVSLYPLATWATGLFMIRMLAAHLWRPSWSVRRKVLVYAVLYWTVLISYESFAYHVLHVANPATMEYPGLPLCDCIHAPPWMQAVYLALGPVYCALTFLLRPEERRARPRP